MIRHRLHQRTIPRAGWGGENACIPKHLQSAVSHWVGPEPEITRHAPQRGLLWDVRQRPTDDWTRAAKRWVEPLGTTSHAAHAIRSLRPFKSCLTTSRLNRHGGRARTDARFI